MTIDRNAQAITEEELALALRDTGAKSGSIIVANPRNGEILAMASTPAYDPARFADIVAEQKKDTFVNPNVSDMFEPGSIFKVLTMAAALGFRHGDARHGVQRHRQHRGGRAGDLELGSRLGTALPT